MNIDTKELEQAVVQQTVESLVAVYSDPNHDIAIQLSSKARELITRRLEKAIDEEIKRLVDDGLEKVVFPRTNRYGESHQPPQTFREFVAEEVGKVFTQTLDNNGNPSNDSWYNKPENQRINRLIRDAIGVKIQEEVMAASRQIQSTIHAHLAEYIKQQLSDVLQKLK